MDRLLSSAFYTSHGPLTQLGKHRNAIHLISSDVKLLLDIVRGVLVHIDCLELYQLSPEDFSMLSRTTLPVEEKLNNIFELYDKPLSISRPPSRRAIATCRDYALMICAFLREKSIPARVRCGFAKYFAAGRYEDHWVCEYWNSDERGWAFADAQLDEEHRASLSIDFDSSDLPHGQFVTAAHAWQMYRESVADSDLFGHGNAKGEWFLRVNLARDALALCKRETSGWDAWRDATVHSKKLHHAELERWDLIADTIGSVDCRPEGMSKVERTFVSELRPFWAH